MSIISWTTKLLPRLTGAVRAHVEEEVVQTIYNFCRESTAWRDMVYGLPLVADDREVVVPIGNGSQASVAGILRVYNNGRQLTHFSHAPWETSGQPTGWTTKPGDPAVIILNVLPSESHAEALDVFAYLQPVNPTAYMPPIILNDFWEFVFDGALGRMYSLPDRPYSNPTMAQYHLKRYRQGTRTARDQAARGFTGNAQNWVFPSFGR